ncbi:hypothetical protein NKH94_29265 [Mesorhizobium australicum]|uniref:hypothetical protein n=1 Tax=Mesorhizobium australicum TaxID=536018 RepID=UPI003334B633
MAVTDTILHCQADREPKSFSESDQSGATFSLSVNLSIDCHASGAEEDIPDDERAAREKIVRFLDAAQNLFMAVYRYRGKGESLVLDDGRLYEVRETYHAGLPADLIQWLDEQKQVLQKKVLPRLLRFWAPEAQSGTSSEVATTSAGAGDRLRAVQSWDAPVGHGLGLTRIIRVQKSLLQDYGLVALPFYMGVEPPPYLTALVETGSPGDDDWCGDVEYDVYGDGTSLKVRATPVEKGADWLKLEYFKPVSLTAKGYLKINPAAAEVHRISRWFEERAALMIAPAAALGPRDATIEEVKRVENLCAFVEERNADGTKIIAYHWDNAVWYGISRLVAALDNLVISIVQPPGVGREGEIVAPFVSLVLDRLREMDPPLTEEQLRTAQITEAIRGTFKDVSPLVHATTDSKLGEAVRHVHAVPMPGGAKTDIVDDSDLVAELVQHFAKAKFGDAVGERLKKYADNVPLARVKVGEVLTRAVGAFEQALNEESGAEAAALRLLETVDLASDTPQPHARFAKRFISDAKVADASKAAVYLAFEQAWIEYRGLLEGPFNGAEAVSRAAGHCLTQALLSSFDKMERMTVGEIADKLQQADYFARRFLGPAEASIQCFDPISAVLINVAPGWRAGVDEHVLRTHLIRSFADAVDPVNALTKPQRFVPDQCPLPLPLQIGANVDGDKVEDFARAMNGIAVAIRRLDDDNPPFAHAHLADLFWTWPSTKDIEPELKVYSALDPMLPAVSDGRAPMFIEYQGYPFADGIPSGGVVDNGNAPADATRPHYSVGPHEPLGSSDFTSLPKLAYGRTYQTFAFVTSNAGTLPLDLQLNRTEAPWMPDILKTRAPKGAPVMDVDYQRTTAISDMTITELDGGPALFGKSIDKVMPLALDYPRAVILASQSNSSYCDLFRSKGGFGEIPIPSNPAKQSSHDVTLADIRWSGKPKSIVLQIMDRLSDQPHVLERMSAAERKRDGLDDSRVGPSFSIPVDGRSELTVTFRTIVPPDGSGGDPARFLVIDGRANVLPSWLDDTCWIRFVVEAPADASACMSFAEVEGSAVAGGPLLLLRPKSTKAQWNKSLRSERRAEVSTPRVGYLDFERWYANPDRRSDLPDRVRRALSLAYALRDVRPELGTLTPRLPDPAVQAVRVDFAMIDTLIDDLSAPPPVLVEISRWLAEVAARIFYEIEKPLLVAAGLDADKPTPWTLDALVEMLKILDEKFRFVINFRAGDQLILDQPSSSYVQATAPEGSVTFLRLHSHVSIEHFEQGTHPSMFDARMLQYASVINGDTTASFPGPTVRMEIMAGFMDEIAGDIAIELAEKMIATEPFERVRRYDLVTLAAMPAKAPQLKLSYWRLLSEVDVTTQRWRPSGRPIYNYIRPEDHVDDSWKKKLAGARTFARELTVDAAVARFEHEAFYDRLHLDAHTLTQRITPMPSRTTLQQFFWEAPSATYFRHRFTLRSRYAGALLRQEDRECPAWPADEQVGSSEQTSPGWARPWTRRVVMLADASRVIVARPQLRALIPLTSAPDTDGRRQPAPPVAAILQEPPFAQGGLADRIAAEVKTGFGYGFKAEQPEGGEIIPVEILDSRKETGVAPYLTYEPMEAASALGMTLIPEGPMGLTFDSVTAPAPAFPNSMFTLRPTSWCEGKLPLEDLMMGVAMRRYIDPAWTAAETIKPSRGKALTLDPDRTWLIGAKPYNWLAGEFVPLPGLFVKLSRGQLPVLTLTVEDGQVVARVSKMLIDGVDTSGVPVVVARFARDKAEDRLFILTQPVSAGRYSTALLAVPLKASIAEGASDIPVVMASFEWSLPKDMYGSPITDGKMGATLLVSGTLGPKAWETIASAQTFLRWTRTGRDFDFIHVAATENYEWRKASVPVDGLEASVLADGTLSIGRGQSKKPIWPCSSTFTSPYPLHVHRHMAVVTSRLLDELGRPIEIYARSAASCLLAPTLVAPSGEDKPPVEHACRVIEYETPAAILCDGNIPGIPETYRTAYFDLLSTGFNSGEQGATLRLFFRFVAPFIHRSSLKNMVLKIGTTYEDLVQYTLGLPPSKEGIVALSATIDSNGLAKPNFQFLDAKGQRMPPKGDIGGKPLVLVDPTAQMPGLYVEVTSNSTSELWMDVSLLHSIGSIAGEPFDFDWLFSPSDGSSPVDSVSPAGLNRMVEAQARIVSVSPPIRLV